MAKNLVICCDGTNNSLQRPLTNVAHLYRLADGDLDKQLPFYDAGVGAREPTNVGVDRDPGILDLIGGAFKRWSGLAFGTGLIENVRDAYVHLALRYEPGDRVYLFGFSRGAYTVRVIAGLLDYYGLLRPERIDQVDDVIRRYRRLFPKDGAKSDPRAPADRLADAARSKRETAVECPVHFMGIFDTVSSLGSIWSPQTFPRTATMPIVRTVRHALALDERRAKFRTNRVTPCDGQDVREVWFAGVHSDVGGGYEQRRDKLSRLPLDWMLREARAAGLLVQPQVERDLQLGAAVAEFEQAEANESLTPAWYPLEYLPLPHRERREAVWVRRWRVYRRRGWRAIRDGDEVHGSVRRRRAPVKNAHWPGVERSVRWVPSSTSERPGEAGRPSTREQ